MKGSLLVFLVVVLSFISGVQSLSLVRSFPWNQTFGEVGVGPGQVIIGAEGLCVLNGPNPRIFALAHSMTYERGIIQELDFYGTVYNTIYLDNSTLVWHEDHEKIAGDVNYIFIGKDFTGCTINLEGNLVLIGKTYYQSDPPQVKPVIFFLNPNSPQKGIIQGPAFVEAPLIWPTDIAFDPTYKSYWMVDRNTNAVYEEVVTCCEEIQYGPLRRWVQQVRMKRVIGLEYGLKGNNNIFNKRDATADPSEDAQPESAHETHLEKRSGSRTLPEQGFSHPIPINAPLPNYQRWISVPAFGDPEGIDIDPDTGNLWILNDAPTTVLYEVTREGQVVSLYQIEQLTSFNDANSVAVTEEYVIIGFDDERTIMIFAKDQGYNNELLSRDNAAATAAQ